MDSIRTAGGGATVENVVFAAAAPDVADVVVDGRAVVVGGKHVTVPDVEVELASAIADLMDASVEATR
jgi:cytosine/adenosine deaminase-related metal-dependent hydrolase